MDIFKLFILNMILLYFLRYNIKFGVILLCITIVYLLLLNNNNIEGNNIDGAKRELKYLDMLNIDRMLNKLVGVFEHSEEDCYGDYTNYSPCDKKCGKSYKYKTYRIERPGGILGSKCEQEDGFRKKKACDKGEGIYPCSVGDKCNVGEDCDTGNCDPKTNTCVTVKVCSDENLDLCDPLKCEDLNNQYDITRKHYVYDVGDKICKIENLDGTNNDNGDNDEPRNQTVNLPIGMGCPWYMDKDTKKSTMTENFCKMENETTVLLSDSDATLRGEKYHIDMPDGAGLYCKEGYKFTTAEGESKIGVSAKIPDETKKEQLRAGCKKPVNSGVDGHVTDDGKCTPGYWPPLKFFKDNINRTQDLQQKIKITDMCKRCDNGFIYIDEGKCCNNENNDSTECNGVDDTFEFCEKESTDQNQYTIINDVYIPTPIFMEPGVPTDIGTNPKCKKWGGDEGPDTCELWSSGGGRCPEGHYFNNSLKAQPNILNCCTVCPVGTYNTLDDVAGGNVGTCKVAQPGEFVNAEGQAEPGYCTGGLVSIDKENKICDHCKTTVDGDTSGTWTEPSTKDHLITLTNNPDLSGFNFRTGCGECTAPYNYKIESADRPMCKPCDGDLQVLESNTPGTLAEPPCKACDFYVTEAGQGRAGQSCSSCNYGNCTDWKPCSSIENSEGDSMNRECTACEDLGLGGGLECTHYECKPGYLAGATDRRDLCQPIETIFNNQIINCQDLLDAHADVLAYTDLTVLGAWWKKILHADDESAEAGLSKEGRMAAKFDRLVSQCNIDDWNLRQFWYLGMGAAGVVNHKWGGDPPNFTPSTFCIREDDWPAGSRPGPGGCQKTLFEMNKADYLKNMGAPAFAALSCDERLNVRFCGSRPDHEDYVSMEGTIWDERVHTNTLPRMETYTYPTLYSYPS